MSDKLKPVPTPVDVTPTVKRPLNVFQKLLLVQNELGTLAKEGKNTNQGYSYAREVDFVHAVKPLFLKNKLAFYMLKAVPAKIEHLVTKDASGNEKTKTLTTVMVQYILKNVEEGAPDTDYISIEASGQGIDNGDKGIYKAITGAKKYALQSLGMIATGDDPEQDEESPRFAAKTTARKTIVSSSTSEF